MTYNVFGGTLNLALSIHFDQQKQTDGIVKNMQKSAKTSDGFVILYWHSKFEFEFSNIPRNKKQIIIPWRVRVLGVPAVPTHSSFELPRSVVLLGGSAAGLLDHVHLTLASQFLLVTKHPASQFIHQSEQQQQHPPQS